MSRLENHRARQFRQRLIIIGLLAIILIGLLATVGLRALVNSSLFVREFISQKSEDTETNQNDNFFGSLNLDPVPEATNSAQLVVSGNAVDFTHIEFYINDQKVEEIDLNDSPQFSEEIGDLKKGVNNLSIKAVNEKLKKEKTSDTFNVSYIDEKPKLEIKEPSDKSRTTKNEISIIGETGKEITIRINNSPVIVDAQGTFRHSVRLKEGENKIKVNATDKAGNKEEQELTVQYEKE